VLIWVQRKKKEREFSLQRMRRIYVLRCLITHQNIVETCQNTVNTFFKSLSVSLSALVLYLFSGERKRELFPSFERDRQFPRLPTPASITPNPYVWVSHCIWIERKAVSGEVLARIIPVIWPA